MIPIQMVKLQSDVSANRVRIPERIGKTEITKQEQDMLRAGLPVRDKLIERNDGRKFVTTLQVNVFPVWDNGYEKEHIQNCLNIFFTCQESEKQPYRRISVPKSVSTRTQKSHDFIFANIAKFWF